MPSRFGGVSAFAATIGLVAGIIATTSMAAPPDNRILQSFDYKGVTLEGPLKKQFDQVRDYYLNIPNDNLLKGFRQRAGQFAPGAEMGGWYSADVFHIFGQVLSGLARMHAATGDQACRQKAEYLLAEWARCIDKDGYFYYTRKPNAPHYTYDKMVGGLVDMYVYLGSKQALDSLNRITDWAVAHLDRSNVYAFNAGEGSTEWYTLSENLYRAYLATGDVKYRDFAKIWEYTVYWALYADGGDIFGKRPDGGPTLGYHAYSHVNTLGGAGAAYRVTGEEHYLKTLIGAYDYFQQHQCVATGGYGPDESLLPEAALADHLQRTHNSFETQCSCWACFKMCKHLIELTGDARYGDWMERLLINGISASIPPTGDGRVFYYADYNPDGAVKRNHGDGWSCCAGTRPMAVADYHALIYFHDANSLCVSLYTPSTLQWTVADTPVTVHQMTKFPESEGDDLSGEGRSPGGVRPASASPGLAGWSNGRHHQRPGGPRSGRRQALGHHSSHLGRERQRTDRPADEAEPDAVPARSADPFVACVRPGGARPPDLGRPCAQFRPEGPDEGHAGGARRAAGLSHSGRPVCVGSPVLLARGGRDLRGLLRSKRSAPHRPPGRHLPAELERRRPVPLYRRRGRHGRVHLRGNRRSLAGVPI